MVDPESKRYKVRNAFLLDASDTEGLLVFLVKLSRENLNDHIRKFLLWVDVSIEIGFSGFKASKSGFLASMEAVIDSKE